jgi:hypothetical protein
MAPWSGTLNFKAMFAKARQAGMKHFFVEHDTAASVPGGSLAGIQTSYTNLRKSSHERIRIDVTEWGAPHRPLRGSCTGVRVGMRRERWWEWGRRQPDGEPSRRAPHQ